MKKILEKKIVVSKEDLDDLNHVNNIVYIHWILDIAKKHWESLVSSQTLENYHWVLLDHNIKYLRPALLKDKIKISTYRLILSGIKELDITNRSGPQKKNTDDNDIKKMLKKMIKQRAESIEVYQKIIEMIYFRSKSKSKKFYPVIYQNK